MEESSSTSLEEIVKIIVSHSHTNTAQMTPPRKKRGYGIRDIDGEYDDFADSVALQTESPIYAYVKQLYDGYERKRIGKYEATVAAKIAASNEFERKQELKIQEKMSLANSYFAKKQEEINLKWEAKKKEIELELKETQRILEPDVLQLQNTKTREDVFENIIEKTKPINEVSNDLKLDEKRPVLDIDLVKFENTQEDSSEKLTENLKHSSNLEEIKLKLEEKPSILPQFDFVVQSKIQDLPEPISSVIEETKQQVIPIDLKNPKPILEEKRAILYPDLVKYTNTQDLLESVTEKTKHINKSSYFFNGAKKVINIPLNQISSSSQTQNMNIVKHFNNLLEGTGVYTSGLDKPFSISQETNGDIHVMNLLAFRFVKKAEVEASENKLKLENLNNLASLGVALITKFPSLAELVQAHFYKICPFLVPFAYPRNGMDIGSYSAALGHQFTTKKETLESTLTQMLLDKLSGYCTLYGFIVRKFSSQSNLQNLTPAQEFFTTKEAWRILAKTVTLEPQEEVTATIINALLEVLGDHLQRAYGLQFKKLLQYIRKTYMTKMKLVTSMGKGGSLTRLELFLDKK